MEEKFSVVRCVSVEASDKSTSTPFNGAHSARSDAGLDKQHSPLLESKHIGRWCFSSQRRVGLAICIPVGVLGIILTVIFCLKETRAQREIKESAFSAMAQSSAAALQTAVITAFGDIATMASLVGSLHPLSASAFRASSASILQQHPYIPHISFARIVEGTERESWEASNAVNISSTGSNTTLFVPAEINAVSTLNTAAKVPAIGYDLLSARYYIDVIRTCAATTPVCVSDSNHRVNESSVVYVTAETRNETAYDSREDLVPIPWQYNTSGNSTANRNPVPIDVYLAISDMKSTRNTLGFVVSAFTIDDLLRDTFDGMGQSGVFFLEDLSYTCSSTAVTAEDLTKKDKLAPPSGVECIGNGIFLSGFTSDDGGSIHVLSRRPEVPSGTHQAIRQFSIVVGGRTWGFTAYSTLDYLKPDDTIVLAILLGGILASLVASGLCYAVLHIGARSHRRAIQRAKQEALAMEAAKEAHEQTVAYAAHELRNPLHLITASANMLKEAIPGTHPARTDIDNICEAANSLHRLVNDVLDYTALRKGRLLTTFAPFEVRPIIRRLAAAHRSMAQVRISWEISADTPRFLVSDALRLQQVLSNGLVNACKFCAQGEIKIHVAVDSGSSTSPTNAVPSTCKVKCPRVCFTITDTGPGLQKKSADVFEPFSTGMQYKSYADYVAARESQSKESSRNEKRRNIFSWRARSVCDEDSTAEQQVAERSFEPLKPPSLTIRAPPIGASSPIITPCGTPFVSKQPRASLVQNPFNIRTPGNEKQNFSDSPVKSEAGTPAIVPSLPLPQSTPLMARQRSDGTVGPSSITARVRGSGLGLPVARLLSQQLGGELFLFRDEQVAVTKYMLCLPLIAPSDEEILPMESQTKADATPSAPQHIDTTAVSRGCLTPGPTHLQSLMTTSHLLLLPTRQRSESHAPPLPKRLDAKQTQDSQSSQSMSTGLSTLPGALEKHHNDANHIVSTIIQRADAGKTAVAANKVVESSSVAVGAPKLQLLEQKMKAAAEAGFENPAPSPLAHYIPTPSDCLSDVLSDSGGLDLSKSVHTDDGSKQDIQPADVAMAAPVQVLPAIMVASPEHVEVDVSARKPRALCVDDERVNRNLMRRMLERHGWECEVLADGVEVVEHLHNIGQLPKGPKQAHHYDVIFLDIVMVYSSGDEVCAELRSKHGLDIPIVAATGNANAVEQLTKCGFSAIISKPFTSEVLKSVLSSLHPD